MLQWQLPSVDSFKQQKRKCFRKMKGNFTVAVADLLVNCNVVINNQHDFMTLKKRNFQSLLTYLLTPWSRVLLEKLTGFQLVQKFSAFHGTRRFIPAFTRSRHLFLSQTRSIHSIPHHSISWTSISSLPFTSRSSKWSLSFRSSNHNPVCTSPLSHTCYMFHPSNSLIFSPE